MKLNKSYFFEFSGMPKAGKTTVIESVRHFFRRNGYSVKNYHGHDRNLDIDKSNARELNFVLAAHAADYIVAHSVTDREPTIHFLDRGIFDRAVFTELMHKQSKIDNNEAEVLTRFLMLEQNRKLVDGLFVFVVEPQISLEREYAGTLIRSPGRVMNKEYLLNFKNTVLDCYQQYGKGFKNKILISTDKESPRDTGITIAKCIWKVIGGDVNEFPIL